MSFFKKLKDRLFKSSSKIDEGLEAIVQEAADEAPAKQDREEAEVLLDSIDSPYSFFRMCSPKCVFKGFKCRIADHSIMFQA